MARSTSTARGRGGFELPKSWELPANWRPGPKGPNAARYWHCAVLQNGRIVATTDNDFAMDIHLEYLIRFIRRKGDVPFLAYFTTLMPHVAYSPLPPYPDTPDPNWHGKRIAGSFESHVAYVDYMVGRLAAAIEELGLREETIFIFAADNGTYREGKAIAAELGARVRLTFNCPARLQRRLVSDALVDFSHLLPTLAEPAGTELTEGVVIDGRSFAHVLEGRPGPTRGWIFSYLAGERILRDRRWLLECDGSFFDCATSRDRRNYRGVTRSNDPEVLAARKRFDRILKHLPAPPNIPPRAFYPRERQRYEQFLKSYLSGGNR